MRRALLGALALLAILTASAPAVAGGWATVRLDEPPGDVVVNEPWQFGFMVLQHDVSPNNDVTPIVRALHKETGEELTFTGRQEGAVGHFVAEVSLPRAGEWKWSIEPQPYGETSFETLVVRGSTSSSIYAANVLTGSCAEPGAIAFSIGAVAPQQMKSKSALTPLALGAATIDAPLAQLVASSHAVGVSPGDTPDDLMACAEIENSTGAVGAEPDEVVLGLRGSRDARNIGVAVLRDEGERTAISLYLLNPDSGAAPLGAASASTTKELAIEIADASFVPFSLEAEVGATVTWTNSSQVAHTVTGDDLAFDDSGLIEPGESFGIVFDEPGTYRYRCGPHPGMVGQIVVS